MLPINKFLRQDDYRLVAHACLRKELEQIYLKEMKMTPARYGSKSAEQTKIHWSRDWEYPWAVINSGVKQGHRVLDCGCGGSPLLPFLARFGCEAYGVDPGIAQPRPSLARHYKQVLERLKRKIERARGNTTTGTGSTEDSHNKTRPLRRIFRLLRRPSDGWTHDAKRIAKLGLDIEYHPDSLAEMRFDDEFFDRVFCISVLEHLPERTAYSGMKEMARVLKKGGLLTVTLDNDGPHVNSDLTGRHRDLINASGLELFGESDFRVPNPSEVPGTYNVVGFILKK